MLLHASAYEYVTLLLARRGPGNDGNEEVLRIPQSFCITGALPSDFLISYPKHSLLGEGSYPSAEMHPVYSTIPADWTGSLRVSFL